jgi:hypothetical protein
MPGTAINCSPAATGVNLNFDTSFRHYGLKGSLNYTGTGTVNCSGGHSVGVALTTQSAPPITSTSGTSNVCDLSQPYDVVDMTGSAGSSYYVVAFYDANGNNQFDTGDQSDVFGPYTTDDGTVWHNITFSGTNIK